MSGAKLLDFGNRLDFGNLDFPDLENAVKQRLKAITSIPDLEMLVEALNPLLKDAQFSDEQQKIIKRLRQRAYDRKRNPKLQISKSGNSRFPNSKPVPKSKKSISKLSVIAAPEIVLPEPRMIPEEKPVTVSNENFVEKAVTEQQQISFLHGCARAIQSIDGERFTKRAPLIVMSLVITVVVSYFLWQQSLALYDTAGFSNAALTAAGSILMIVGFAGYHSMTRSWIALLLCIYAGAYEGYLMVSGTIQDEKQVATNAVQNNPELLFLKENVQRTRERYQELKQRYDNPEAKVFKNEWFLKSSINPAWDAMSKAHENLITKQASFTGELTEHDATKLKIAYRLGLVFLCMVLVHQFFATCRTHQALVNRN